LAHPLNQFSNAYLRACKRTSTTLAPTPTPTQERYKGVKPISLTLKLGIGAQQNLEKMLFSGLKALVSTSGSPQAISSGADGDRTRDLHAASVALSQLSYGPKRLGKV
jgi:hypothetical protein